MTTVNGNGTRFKLDWNTSFEWYMFISKTLLKQFKKRVELLIEHNVDNLQHFHVPYNCLRCPLYLFLSISITILNEKFKLCCTLALAPTALKAIAFNFSQWKYLIDKLTIVINLININIFCHWFCIIWLFDFDGTKWDCL